jgi:hypothetical protein
VLLAFTQHARKTSSHHAKWFMGSFWHMNRFNQTYVCLTARSRVPRRYALLLHYITSYYISAVRKLDGIVNRTAKRQIILDELWWCDIVEFGKSLPPFRRNLMPSCSGQMIMPGQESLRLEAEGYWTGAVGRTLRLTRTFARDQGSTAYESAHFCSQLTMWKQHIFCNLLPLC